MMKTKNAVKDSVLDDDVVGRIVEAIAGPVRMMTPNAVFERNQIYNYVQVKLAQNRSLHSRERLPTGEKANVAIRHGRRCEKKDVADQTVDSSVTDETQGDRLIG